MSDKIVKSWNKYRKQAGVEIGSDRDTEYYENWAKGQFGERLGGKLSQRAKELKKSKASSKTKDVGKKKALSLTKKLRIRKLETELWSVASKSKRAKLKAQIASLKEGK